MRIRHRTERADSEPPGVGDRIAGWRLVRRLPGGCSRMPEFVAVCDAAAPSQAGASAHWSGFDDGAPTPLEHRRAVVASGEDARALARDCAVRERLGSEFAEAPEELLHVDGVCLAISPLQSRRSFAAIVADGAPLEPGACVTLLVPVIEVVARAHAAGIGHSALSLRNCSVDFRGRPGVDGWADAVELEEVSALRADLVRAGDRRALGRLADAVLELSTRPAPSPLRELVAAMVEGVGPVDAASRCIDALFAWTAPTAVPESALGPMSGGAARAADDAGVDGAVREPAAPRGAADPFDDLLETPSRGRRRPVEPGLLDDEPPTGSLDAGDEAARSGSRASARPGRRPAGRAPLRLLGELRLRAPAIAGQVRPALWAGVGGVGAVCVLAGLLIPGFGGADASVAEPGTALTEQGAGMPAPHPQEPVPAGGAGGPDAGDGDAAGADADAPDGLPAPDGSAPAEADAGGAASERALRLAALDASGLAAAPVLAQLRDECLLAGDAECIGELYAPGAPGTEADLAAIAAGTAADRALAADEWLLAADLGDIELVRSGGEEGAMSLERTEDGWRLREVWLGRG